MGTPAPVAVAALATSGLFAVLCQPREDTDANGRLETSLGPRGEPNGDALSSILVIGAGEGEIIDELLAIDPRGRFLVVRRDQDFVLVDALEGSRIDLGALGADLVDDALPHPSHRSLSFDAAGLKLAYLRKEGERSAAVVRELLTGREWKLELGPGQAWRVQLDPSGRWLIAAMIVEDRNGNGKLDWSVPRATAPRFPCRLPVMRHAAFEARLDAVSFTAIPTSGGEPRQVPGLVTPLGERLIVREPDGRLMLEDSRGGQVELLPAACEGRVQHADGDRGLALVSCRRPRGKPLLRLVGDGVNIDLGLEGHPRTDAWVAESSPRLIAVYPGQEAALVDLDERTIHPLTTRDLVLGTHGSRALVLRSERLVITDVADGTTIDLGVNGVRMPEVLQAGEFVLATPYLVDLASAHIRGHLARRPLALLPSGRVLVALGSDADATELARGPLGWAEIAPFSAAPL